MSPWTSAGWPCGWICVEAAARAQAHQDAHVESCQGHAQLHRLIAGIEGEDGTRLAGLSMAEEGANLLGCHLSDVLTRLDAMHPQGGSPTGAALGDLDKPGIIPACNNGLTTGMTGVVMVVASLWTGFRIAARPDAGIDRVPGGRGLQWLCCHQMLQAGQRHSTSIERIVDTSPSTLEAGGQAEMDRMLDDSDGKQGIEHLKQCVTTTAEGGINGLTKGTQALKGRCVHAVSMPKRAFRVYPSSPSPCCWLNGKLSLCFNHEGVSDGISNRHQHHIGGSSKRLRPTF